MIRVYIAGASKEPERVRRWMEAVRAEGWHLTLDWLAMIAEAGAANEGLGDEQREQAAVADLRAVREADVVWLLAPDNASAGAWVEFGYALASGHALVFASGPARMRSIFCALVEEHDTDEAAFEAIRRVGGRAA